MALRDKKDDMYCRIFSITEMEILKSLLKHS